MSASLLDLPGEILDQIFRCGLLDVRSLARASRCCRYLHELLLPLVLKQVSFTSDERSCKSAFYAVHTGHQYVKSLYFTAKTLPIGWSDVVYTTQASESLGRGELRAGDRPREEELVSQPATVLHGAARELLSGKYTPGVTTVTVRFDLLIWDYGLAPEYYITSRMEVLPDIHFHWHDQHNRSQQFFHETESSFLWLARMNAIWQSIATNRRIKTLKLHNLIPITASIVFEDRWKAFLNQLESLEISVPLGECDGGFGRPKLALESESSYELGLQQWMGLAFAQNLRHLELRGSASYKVYSSLLTVLWLQPQGSPYLTSLQLHSIEITVYLPSWLPNKIRVLRSLEMYNCWCGALRLPDHGPWTSWAVVFRIFTEADADSQGSVALEKIVIQAGDCKEPSSYIPLSTPKPDEWPQHVDTAHRDGGWGDGRPYGGPFKLKNRRLGPPFSFLYSRYIVDEDYWGGWGGHIDPHMPLMAYERGYDTLEYEKLLRIVERNNAKAEGS